MFLEQGAHRRLRLRADKAVYRLPVLHQHHRRQAAHTELARDRLLLVAVDLGKQHLAGVFAREFFEYRQQHLAGTAPVRPEIDQHQTLVRLVDQHLLRIRGCDLDHQFRHPQCSRWIRCVQLTRPAAARRVKKSMIAASLMDAADDNFP